jgi:hypothetical protein
MSDNTSLTSEAYYGTQMKPDAYEPATAEWFGRLTADQCWTFARQQQVLFVDPLHRTYDLLPPYEDVFYTIFERNVWLNEVFGTLGFTFNFYKTTVEDTAVAITATLTLRGPDTVIGTAEGTYTTAGWKSLTIPLDADWHKTDLDNYGRLRVHACGYDTDPLGTVTLVRLNYCQLRGLPRD